MWTFSVDAIQKEREVSKSFKDRWGCCRLSEFLCFRLNEMEEKEKSNVVRVRGYVRWWPERFECLNNSAKYLLSFFYFILGIY
jgi:hypothetical protein